MFSKKITLMLKKILLLVGLISVFGMYSCENADKKETDNKDSVENSDTEETITELSDDEKQDLIAKGKEIAQKSQKTLGKNLKAAMKKGGPAEAIGFCSLNAMPLTDSLSTAFSAEIHRVSHKNRNPKNLADNADMEFVKMYQEKISASEELKPQIKAISNEEAVFYAPIVTKGMCLACHGIKGETFSDANAKLITEKYPEDKAFGFKEGELRGMWKLILKRTK